MKKVEYLKEIHEKSAIISLWMNKRDKRQFCLSNYVGYHEANCIYKKGYKYQKIYEVFVGTKEFL